MNVSTPTVAISADIFDCLARLSSNASARASSFIQKFKSNPRSAKVNLKPIRNAADSRFRSVRIDRNLRGILLQLSRGNLFILLWIDNHDKAYAWATKRRATVNAETGAIQVFSVTELTRSPSEGAPEGSDSGSLFSDLSESKMRRLGVPDEQIPWVRSLNSYEELNEHPDRLPPDALDSLKLKAMGLKYPDIVNELESSQIDKPFKPDDFREALETTGSKRNYWVVDDDTELQRMLDSPLEKWRVFLHPAQRKLVERNWNGPVRVLGGPGTGKTVVAMHRARWLARNWLQHDNERILFTTYTTNLVEDIKNNLRSLCDTSVLKRIEVTNVDRWVRRYLYLKGDRREIVFPGSKSKFLDVYWREAMQELGTSEFDLRFLRSEWRNVVQANAITTWDEYRTVSRTGRGTPLNRLKRRSIWRAFEAYRTILDEHGQIEPDDAYRQAGELLEKESSARRKYRSVVVDEAQDMGMAAFGMLRKIVPERRDEGDTNSMFIVGDTHQRIYGSQVVLSRCGINIMGRGRKLRVNYRTSEEIRNWGVKIVKGLKIDDLDGASDNNKGYHSLYHGPPPEVAGAPDREKEVQTVVDWIDRLERELPDPVKNGSICLIARTKRELEPFRQELQGWDIDVLNIERNQADDGRSPGVRLATMHRAKGLEYLAVAIVAVNKGIVPLQVALDQAPDEAAREDIKDNERRLLFVAATRAKKKLLVTCSGQSSELLEHLIEC